MGERGLTVDVSFDLAHFKVHTTMKGRTSYLIPLPTTVLGFFFSILGRTREEYLRDRMSFKAGAKLLALQGIARENAQLIKFKGKGVRTTEEIMLLVKPKYRFAIWGSEAVIDEIYQRLERLELEFVPYGGLSDFIFSDIETPELHTKYKETRAIWNSYTPQKLLKYIEIQDDSTIYTLPYVYKGFPKFVVMGWNVKLELNRTVPTLRGVPLYHPTFGEEP